MKSRKGADATERRTSEEASDMTRQRMDFYVNNSPLATIEVDADIIITRWAGEAERVFGWTEAETVGRPLLDLHLIYEEDAPRVQSTMEQLASGTSRHIVATNRNCRKDGRVITCEWHNTVLTDSQGKMTAILAQALDISKRVESETALRESENFLNSIIENIPLVVFVKDAEELRFVKFNRAGQELLGIPKDEIIGKNDYDLFPPAEADYFTAWDRKVLAGDRAVDIPEEHVQTKRGQRVMHTRKIALKDQHGSGEYLLGIAEDITERKRIEAELANALESLEQQVQERTVSLTETNQRLLQEIEERKRIEEHLLDYQHKLETMGLELSLAADRERGRIAGELHDQVGQRLILGKMKLDGLASQLGDDGHGQTIAEVNHLIDETIKDIRSLTFQLRPPILANAGLAAAVRWLGEELKANYGLLVDVEYDGAPIGLNYETKYLLFQVIRELLLNVVKHAKTDRASCSLATDGRNLSVTVTDYGIGISMEGPAETDGQAGGFGLFNVRQRIEHLGGRLAFEALEGRAGCRATITVPLLADGERNKP